MNICIIVPSSEYLAQAGVRIRYERISAQLITHGVVLNFKVIDEFNRKIMFNDDVYIISKVYDFRAVLLASEIQAAGKLVGPDLFDDYFSDQEDYRFTRLRSWLRELAKFSSFALCSTQKIKSRLRSYFAHLPMHVMNDPAEIDVESLQSVLDEVERKKAEFADNKVLNILWFGIGDNPHFDVGIQDLVRYAPSVLRRLKAVFPNINLTLLTNQRALTVDTYQRLKRLPVAYDLQLWTELKERSLLADTTIALLPVNYQGFSKVKSYNRAITALSYGAQVLSLGFDLYESLNKFIYRDVEELIEGLQSDSLKFSNENVQLIKEKFKQYASASAETLGLVSFLRNLDSPNDYPQSRVKLVNLGSTLDKNLYLFASNFDWVCISPPVLGKRADKMLTIELNKSGNVVIFVGKGAQMVLNQIQSGSEEPKSSIAIQEKLTVPHYFENPFNYGGNSFFNYVLNKQSISITESVLHSLFPNHISINAETSKSFFAY